MPQAQPHVEIAGAARALAVGTPGKAVEADDAFSSGDGRRLHREDLVAHGEVVDLRADLLDEVIEEFSLTIEVGFVIRSEPAEGTMLEAESVVQLVVSKGPEIILVPSLEQLGTNEPDDVQSQLEEMGFVVVRQEAPLPFEDPLDRKVVEIRPAPGSEAFPESEITLLVGVADPNPPTTTTTTTTTTEGG